MITIKFASDMYVYTPDKKATIALPCNYPRPLRDILGEVGLTGAEIGFVLLNNQMLNLLSRDFDILIQDNDVIELYPFIGGG